MMTDIRFAFRQLFKSPGFTILAVLTLALGIGLNTAIFSLINDLFLRPLPFKDPERLVHMYSNARERNLLELPISAREYEATNPDSDELRTPYLEDDRLDLSAWARDAIALALPLQILCRPECAGLCPVCGKDLNAEPHTHHEEKSDSRWAALAELRDRL